MHHSSLHRARLLRESRSRKVAPWPRATRMRVFVRVHASARTSAERARPCSRGSGNGNAEETHVASEPANRSVRRARACVYVCDCSTLTGRLRAALSLAAAIGNPPDPHPSPMTAPDKRAREREREKERARERISVPPLVVAFMRPDTTSTVSCALRPPPRSALWRISGDAVYRDG